MLTALLVISLVVIFAAICLAVVEDDYEETRNAYWHWPFF